MWLVVAEYAIMLGIAPFSLIPQCLKDITLEVGGRHFCLGIQLVKHQEEEKKLIYFLQVNPIGAKD